MKAISSREAATSIDAEFDIAFEGDSVHLTVHARGGAASSGTQTNPGYEVLVQVLLERLKAAGSRLMDVRLASKTVAHLPASKRSIRLQSCALPLLLADVADVADLRLAIRRAVVTAHSRSKVPTHGNATKRIELVASCPIPAGEMVTLLQCGSKASPTQRRGFKGDEEDVFMEGKKVLRVHLLRERNRTLVTKAKADFRLRHGRLHCEACDFDYRDVYGDLGADFIEAHHDTPLSDRELGSETRVHDLRMVCANCHRMLHRNRAVEPMTVADLRRILRP